MASNDITTVELLVMYKDCRRNHAPPGKGFILDGCGLFASRGESGSPDDMLCAACNCHRNFHRRLTVDFPPHLSSQLDRRQQAPTSPSASCTTVDQAPRAAPAQQGASAVRKKRTTKQ